MDVGVGEGTAVVCKFPILFTVSDAVEKDADGLISIFPVDSEITAVDEGAGVPVPIMPEDKVSEGDKGADKRLVSVF